MDRLTRRLTLPDCFGSDGMNCAYCPEYGSPCNDDICRQALIDRLRAIEDILGDSYELDRLRQLVEADRDGRCVVLPCKADSLVYLLCGNEIFDCWVLNFEIRTKTTKATLWSINILSEVKVDIDCFGKTVFLTREDAEAAIGGAVCV